MNRRSLMIAAMLLVTTIATTASAVTPKVEEKPNFVIILVDDKY